MVINLIFSNDKNRPIRSIIFDVRKLIELPIICNRIALTEHHFRARYQAGLYLNGTAFSVPEPGDASLLKCISRRGELVLAKRCNLKGGEAVAIIIFLRTCL